MIELCFASAWLVAALALVHIARGRRRRGANNLGNYLKNELSLDAYKQTDQMTFQGPNDFLGGLS